jgi:hypothetical protein
LVAAHRWSFQVSRCGCGTWLFSGQKKLFPSLMITAACIAPHCHPSIRICHFWAFCSHRSN